MGDLTLRVMGGKNGKKRQYRVAVFGKIRHDQLPGALIPGPRSVRGAGETERYGVVKVLTGGGTGGLEIVFHGREWVVKLRCLPMVIPAGRWSPTSVGREVR